MNAVGIDVGIHSMNGVGIDGGIHSMNHGGSMVLVDSMNVGWYAVLGVNNVSQCLMQPWWVALQIFVKLK